MADPSFTCCPPVSRHQLDNNAVFLSSLQPLFTVGWPVFYFIHTQPNIALLPTSFSPLWHHQKLFAVLVIVICFHFSKNKSYCCPVSWLGLLSLSSLWKSCPRNLQKLQKSRPRNSRDDSPLPALLSLWHVFPRFAAIF